MDGLDDFDIDFCLIVEPQFPVDGIREDREASTPYIADNLLGIGVCRGRKRRHDAENQKKGGDLVECQVI